MRYEQACVLHLGCLVVVRGKQRLRGDFAACGPELTPEAMRAYLNEAKALSNDYYVGMLVDDLLEAVDAEYPAS